MATLVETAQNCMDLYYQQFKSDEDFFELYHFKYLCGVAQAKLLQVEYEKAYARSLQIHGIPEARMNPQWFISENVELKASDIADKEIELKDCPFTFLYDASSTGIENVYPLNGKCGDFIRMSIDDKWKLKSSPATNIVWWFPFGKKIGFMNLHCGLKQVKVVYIPSLAKLEDTCGIADGIEADIITWVLNLMAAARNGAVVDMTNDQNPNKVIESEINTAFGNLKTKPR